MLAVIAGIGYLLQKQASTGRAAGGTETAAIP
jgi:hypothetical protein